jgi:Ca2+-transporting ATPase
VAKLSSDTSWHSLSIEGVVEKLGSSSDNGLSDNEVASRQKSYGLNKLPEEKELTKLMLFLHQFKSPLIYILLLAGIVTLYLHEYTDAIVIFAAVIINTIIGYVQENKVSEAMKELKKILKVKALVVRDGREMEIIQENLVPGDIIILKPGFKVPADARLIQSDELKVNESALTGEWEPADKNIEVFDEKTSMADRDNMVHMGTVVEAGNGRAVVVETGVSTEIGKVAELVKETKEEKTPYQKKLIHFSKIVGIFVGVMSVLIFAEGMITGGDFKEIFTTSIAVAVAAIPEGLPVSMTVILAIGAERILRRKGLVRKLASAETLGSTSVICTDKTGTLTEAKMKVSSILTTTKEITSHEGKYSETINKDNQTSEALALKIAMSVSDAFVENPQDQMQDWVVRGRPTDRALMLAGIQAGFTKKDIEAELPQVEELPFDSVTKYSATLRDFSDKEYVLFVLGAPELVLGMASQTEIDGTQEKLSAEKSKELREKYEQITARGMRVLATAYKKIEKSSLKKSDDPEQKRKFIEEHLKDIVFAGFIALRDPLRPEVKEAIRTCKKAGMKPIIITGDHKLTARAVAVELGFKIKDNNIVEGRELREMSDAEFDKRVSEIDVYARVEPAQKLRIVKALQAKGEVVAMTGDGINDAPALKQADIGVALGSGTDVAKEVSDLVLLDDNFSVIVAAVEEGRGILDNIRKVITYLLSDSFTEVILVGSSMFAGLPLPITAAQILWVNLIEDGLPGIALAFEPKEKDIMEQKPERHDTPLLTKEMKTIIFAIGILTDIALFGIFLWLLGVDHEITHIRTMVFAALTIDSLFYVFSCKSLRHNLWHTDVLSNKYLVIAWIVGIVMLFVAIYVPTFQTLLDTVPLSTNDWGLLFGLGLLELVMVELTKWYFVRRKEFT